MFQPMEKNPRKDPPGPEGPDNGLRVRACSVRRNPVFVVRDCGVVVTGRSYTGEPRSGLREGGGLGFRRLKPTATHGVALRATRGADNVSLSSLRVRSRPAFDSARLRPPIVGATPKGDSDRAYGFRAGRAQQMTTPHPARGVYREPLRFAQGGSKRRRTGSGPFAAEGRTGSPPPGRGLKI